MEYSLAILDKAYLGVGLEPVSEGRHALAFSGS
jgi:hypothetical protein